MKRSKEKQSGARRKTHPLELKLQVLQQLNAGASVTDVCRAFGLAVATVALWRRAYAQGGYEALFPKTPGPAKVNEAAPDPRREAVIALKKANPEYGTRRIRDVLKRFEALPISETEVRRMLHEAKLLERPPAAPRPEPGPRRFERAEPNQLWQSDLFTFLLRRHERIYLCAFMDDHSRFLLGWSMARHQKEFLVREALDRAIAKYGVPKEVLTDNGRQYTVWRGTTRFEEELRRQGSITSSRGRSTRRPWARWSDSGRPCGRNFSPAPCLPVTKTARSGLRCTSTATTSSGRTRRWKG